MSTKKKLIAAAEKCFYEKGFSATSLREITKRARANVASVNYHFGDKKQLIQAVFERYLSAFDNNIRARLDLIQSSESVSAETLIRILLDSILETRKLSASGELIFIRLLNLAYSEQQGHLRKYVVREYPDTFEKVVSLLQVAIPGWSRAELFWRVHFLMGSVFFTLNSWQALHDISESEFSYAPDESRLLEELTAFVIGGLQAHEEIIQ